ncbi:uncharacterized protein LOC110177012 [Drosophila serrata]|uniref:uncharacterized protein LOC110177012 n=1 Tax=Drosophila serrata TaxID=7274 RepID=UPI000A1D253E|nr:uncharacterized protein LOC110177012 [Drosophila serrata]
MAEDENQIEHEVVEPKEPIVAGGACTRWLQRVRRTRFLRWIALPKVGGNKIHRDQEAQLQNQVQRRLFCYWMLIGCFALGLFLERYIHSRAPSMQDSYCKRSYRLGDMMTHVRRQVLLQEQALDQLEWALDNGTFRNIALVGTPDVGKSHTARSLRETFPWPENVKTLSWRESPSLLRVQSMLKNLLLCGQNLILIDDLTPLNGHLVPIINELIRGRKEIAQASSSSKKSESDPRLKQLTSIFIFTLDRHQPEEIFQAEMAALKELPETHVIIYAALEHSQLAEVKNVAGSEELDQDIEKVRVNESNDDQEQLTKEETYSPSFNFLY